MKSAEQILKEAHSQCRRNKKAVLQSQVCGCFYCISLFPPNRIREWVDKKQTPLCPICSIDSVLPQSVLPTHIVSAQTFLQVMYDHWFGTSISAAELKFLQKSKKGLKNEK